MQHIPCANKNFIYKTINKLKKAGLSYSCVETIHNDNVETYIYKAETIYIKTYTKLSCALLLRTILPRGHRSFSTGYTIK